MKFTSCLLSPTTTTIFVIIISMIVIMISSSSSSSSVSAAATFSWSTGACATSSEVYSSISRSCITNPCTGTAVFDAASETCVCPAGQVITPPGSLPITSGSPTCVTCSSISQMENRPAETLTPPQCLPCAADVLTTPPTTAFRNLFLYQATTTVVTLEGTTWVYGGGNILAVDGSVSQDRVAILAAKWNSTYSRCGCPIGFVLSDTLASGVRLKAYVCIRCTNATNATVAGPTSATALSLPAGATPFSCIVCGGGSFYDYLTSSCVCASGQTLVPRLAQDGGDWCAPASVLSALTSGGSVGSLTSTPLNVDNTGVSGPASASYLLSTYAISAAVSCGASKNATACQFLANLCALTLYDMSSAPCVLHLRLHRAEGCTGIINCEIPKTVPWLHYLRSSSSVFQQTLVNMRVSLRPRSDASSTSGPYVYKMKFVVFEYDVFGSLLARRRLTDDLSLCDIATSYANEFFYVGRRNTVNCNINIRYYLQQSQLKSATRMYELYLEDSDGSLIPVPVVLDSSDTSTQVPDSTDSGSIFRSSSTDQNPVNGAWRRRFFMIDNIASRAGSISDTTRPSHITYARRVALMVHLREIGTSSIFVPVVLIQYASSLITTSLLASTDFASGELRNLETNNTSPGTHTGDAPIFEYRTTFVRSDDEVISAIKPTVIVLCCIVFLTAFFKTYGWMRRQQDLNLGFPTIFRFFIFLCNHFANMFAVFTFLCCGAFYVFYKHQSAAEWLVPVNLSYVWGFLYTALGTKFVVVIHNMIEQCNADYFVIDWERPRPHHGATPDQHSSSTKQQQEAANKQHTKQQVVRMEDGTYQVQNVAIASPSSTTSAAGAFGGGGAFGAGSSQAEQEFEMKQQQEIRRMQQQINTVISSTPQKAAEGSVSMWRSTFVANELNELQTRRSFHVLFVILVVTVFLEGIGYNRLALSVPNSELTGNDPYATPDPILRVAIGAFFWVIVSVVVYVIEHQIFFKFISVHPLRAFADLCSVSNISIMILLEPQWGFYIHGESLHAFADASLEEFQQNLKREAQGNMPQRGLGGVQECQTFEVYIGAFLRNFLYVCYAELSEEARKAMNGDVEGGRGGGQQQQQQIPGGMVGGQERQQLQMINAGHHRRCFEFLLGGSGRPSVYTPQTMSVKKQINTLLQQSVRNAQKNILFKYGLHAVMDFPPNVLYMNGPFAGERAGTDLFFFDEATSYDLAFMSGLDFDLFILYGLLFATIDANIFNTFWSMMIIYLIDCVFSWYREKEGTANLGSKTLFDERFFL